MHHRSEVLPLNPTHLRPLPALQSHPFLMNVDIQDSEIKEWFVQAVRSGMSCAGAFACACGAGDFEALYCILSNESLYELISIGAS